MISEPAHYPNLYPEIFEIIYAPRWYYILSIKPDDYSHQICYYSKKQDKSAYFFPYVKEVVDLLNYKHAFDDLKLIVPIPSHTAGSHSPTLTALAEKLSQYLHVPYENIISREKTTRVAGQRFENRLTRYLSVKDTMKVTRQLNEIKVLLLDDVKTTGITILEAKKILLEAGAKKTVAICLGINSSIDRNGELEVKK